jgi:hypothetical protein
MALLGLASDSVLVVREAIERGLAYDASSHGESEPMRDMALVTALYSESL